MQLCPLRTRSGTGPFDAMDFPNFSDPQFVQQLKSRDRAALERLVDAYLHQLLRAARGMGFLPDESEDLAQAAFLAFIESAERFEGRSHVRTFLFGIFYNKVSEYLRHKQRARQEDEIDSVLESRFDRRGFWRQPPADIERQIFSKEAASIIRDCLERVPEAQRMAFVLREMEEMDSKEICKTMGISTTNLGVMLFRVRNRLRECVERKGLKKG